MNTPPTVATDVDVESGHTPLPWLIERDCGWLSIIGNAEIDGGTYCVIVEDMDGANRAEAAANAALIVRAVNSHGALVEALERLAIFHQPAHPRHDALHEEYAEECIANEISFSGATLLDSLVRAANAAIAIGVQS